MRGHAKALTMTVAVATLLSVATALAQPVDTARIAGGDPNDWLAYHQSYNGWSYSPLDQINANNVKDLEVAWIAVPGHSTRGLQSMPLAADGVLYYTGSYSRVFALDGATGKQLWSYTPELDDALVARRRRISPYNRRAAIGEGRLYVGTVDGRLIALDMKTGKVAWDTKLQDLPEAWTESGSPARRSTPRARWSSAARAANGQAKARSMALTPATGKVKWKFKLPWAALDRSKQSYGNDSWRTGGRRRRGCRARSEPETNIRLLGHSKPEASVRLGWRQMENRKGRDPVTTSTPRRCSPSTSIPAT